MMKNPVPIIHSHSVPSSESSEHKTRETTFRYTTIERNFLWMKVLVLTKGVLKGYYDIVARCFPEQESEFNSQYNRISRMQHFARFTCKIIS